MRHAAYSDVATVHLEHDVEVLERKLMALRAEIDAVLSQLASEKVGAPAIKWVPTLEAATESTEPGPTAPPQNEITTEPSLAGEASRQLIGAMPTPVVALDQPSAVAMPSQAAHEAPSSEILASDSQTPVDAFDQTPAVAESAETAAPQVEMQFNPAREAAMPIAPATSMEPGSPHPAPVEPSAAAAPQRPEDGVPAPAVDAAASAAAQVIGLGLRRRNERRPAETFAPIRSRRRLATKIAASIIALLVAATMLVIADKQAVGSALTLPWMSSHLPAKASRSLGDRQGARQDSPTDDRRDARSAGAAADEALLLRYREAWSTGW
jgi:hypothetical protein